MLLVRQMDDGAFMLFSVSCLGSAAAAIRSVRAYGMARWKTQSFSTLAPGGRGGWPTYQAIQRARLSCDQWSFV